MGENFRIWNTDFIIKELHNFVENNDFSMQSISKRNQDLYMAIKRMEKETGNGFNYFINKLTNVTEEQKQEMKKYIITNEHKFRSFNEAIENLREYIIINKSIKNLQKDNNALYIYLCRQQGGLIGCMDEIFGTEYDYRDYLPQVSPKYWNSEDRVSTILKNYIDENGSLKDIRNNDQLLYHAMQSRKLIEYYVEKLGYNIKEMNPPKKIKCKGYWRKWRNVKLEIGKVIEENKFPSYNYLINRGVAAQAIGNFGGIDDVREKMGFEDPRPKAIDGHTCKSKMEKEVDDFIFLMKNEHLKEGDIQFGLKKYKADFLLKDGKIVEVWGLNDDKYNERRKIKTEFYTKYFKGQLISIEIKHLSGSYLNIIRNLRSIFSDYVFLDIEDELLLEQLFVEINEHIEYLRIVLKPLLIDNEFIPSVPDINKYIEQEIISKERGEHIKKIYSKIGSVEYMATKLGWKNKMQYVVANKGQIVNKKPYNKKLKVKYSSAKIDELKQSFYDLYNLLGFLPTKYFIKQNYCDIYKILKITGGYEEVKKKYELCNLYDTIVNSAKRMEKKGDLRCPICGSSQYRNSGFNNNKTFKRYDCKNKKCNARYSSLMSAQKIIAVRLSTKAQNTSNQVCKKYLLEEAERLSANKFFN